ncbi:unnamed protein product [Psylliodes chrysocephalus]|uniref:Uncharacterized protein n=1 Tax=Psylliodes chrysocephalus TaxID=3402493 RepID=A0A9P0DE48_9CUCU|nr:unnamed protein product [Psylliodes chrysocephala]
MNNLNSSSHTNVKTVIQDFVRENEQCVLERFTEGVLEAVIGDSADEGYSTGLRKLYMVVLSWRRNKASAHFNIKRTDALLTEYYIQIRSRQVIFTSWQRENAKEAKAAQSFEALEKQMAVIKDINAPALPTLRAKQ